MAIRALLFAVVALWAASIGFGGAAGAAAATAQIVFFLSCVASMVSIVLRSTICVARVTR